jgi:hypothetical protein
MISVPSVDGRCKYRENERERNAAFVVYPFAPRYIDQGVCMPVRLHIRSNERCHSRNKIEAKKKRKFKSDVKSVRADVNQVEIEEEDAL